jgi:carbon-monoxide dehydrogenase medium subunit
MEFHSPETLAEASELLARDREARFLAGGVTLVQQMNAGAVEPSTIVSLAKIPALRGCESSADGTLRVGAMVTHREIAFECDLRGDHALLAEAARRIGNPAVRNMGTLGGSLAFADPACDYLPALVALGATIELCGPRGTRTAAVADFLLAANSVDLRKGEIVRAVALAPRRKGCAVHYERLARTHGDGAIASVAIALRLDAGRCETLRIAVGGCAPTPLRRPSSEGACVGGTLDESAIAGLSRELAAACDPQTDLRASAAYRRSVLPRLIGHALRCALQKANAS